MSMISEQVKGLRKLANQWKHNDVAGCNLIFDACDTIEALSAKVRAADRPTGSDFISKAKVLETYSELYWFDSDCEVVSKAEVDKIYERLQSLPSADRPQGEWIPVSERLPIPPTFCLVTTDGSHGDVIDIALYMSDGWHKASEVIAWMPLPEPYKGGEKK